MNVQHLQVYAGEDRTLTLYARDPSNNPKEITSRLVNWRVGRSPFRLSSRAAIFEKYGTITDADSGVFAVQVARTDTECLRPGDYEHMAVLDDGALSFVNNAGELLQFVNNDGGELYFFNGFGGTLVVTAGRFRVLSRIDT
jgi:hypothetical protein